MKTIGLIGGMSWESSIEYYRLVNQLVKKELGGLASAKVIMNSLNFEDVVAVQKAGDWEKAGKMLGEAAKNLENAGADYVLLCTNTMHLVSDKIQAAINVPFIHIADVTAEQILKAGYKNVALLGTRYTMEQDFYRDRLTSHGLNVMVPNDSDMDVVSNVIFDELCKGQILDKSREEYLRVIKDLQAQGAECVVLGCTEISLLVKPEISPIPAFDTTEIHATKAVELSLCKEIIAVPA